MLEALAESSWLSELKAQKEASQRMKVEIRRSLDKQMRDREARKHREVHFVNLVAVAVLRAWQAHLRFLCEKVSRVGLA